MRLFAALCAALCVTIVACSSAPAKKNVDAGPAEVPEQADGEFLGVAPGNLDTAHAAFIQALDLELRGLQHEADSMWMLAWRYDPRSRYLSFKVAQKMLAVGADSVAFTIAKQANNLKGKKTVSQFETMAHLYLKAGVADSTRKYFMLALDSSKYQDMKLLYDYSLFLEAVQDKKELVRIYDLLLPQTNFIQSLLGRQVNLLVELGRDSALVDLFERAHEATGQKDKLARMVQVLVIQKRYAEVRAIADTITSSLDDDAVIIELALLSYANSPKEETLKFLKKKYYTDGVRVPELQYHLGILEHMEGEVDSAWAHLEGVHLKLSRDRSYGAQACRNLSAMAFGKNNPELAVMYAERADSLLSGEGKVFLAIALGTAKKYEKAYALLDSMLEVWSRWRPLEAIADSAQMATIKARAAAKYHSFQRAYADVLLLEAGNIEKHSAKDTLKMAKARELRTKAELFWESVIAEDSLNIQVRYEMAMNLERLNRIDECFAMFEYIVRSPLLGELDSASVFNYYGYTLLNLNRKPGDVEKGIALVDRALSSFAPGKAPDAIKDSKAWGLYKQGKYPEALNLMMKIDAKMFDGDKDYLEHLAAIHAALGNRTEAVKAYRRLLKVRPGDPEALKYLKGKK